MGNLTLNNCTLSGDSALYGGGVYSYTGNTFSNFATATITNSTLSGNSAAIRGGGIGNYGAS